MGWWAAGVALLLVIAASWWLRRTMVVVTVDGLSMQPSYPDGATVLARRARSARTGQVVMLAPPHDGPATGRPGRLWLMKRVAATSGERVPAGLGPALTEAAGTSVPAAQLVVLGDNPDHSYDSRAEGFVAAHRIRAVVLIRVG